MFRRNASSRLLLSWRVFVDQCVIVLYLQDRATVLGPQCRDKGCHGLLLNG
jgi:hypothetical protein